MMRLHVGNKNYSSWSMRAWVLMRQARIDFEETLVRFDSFDADSEFKRQLAGLSPTGKVPVLETTIDGQPQVIWDTLAIAEYLAERFPDRGLWPDAAGARARARSVVAEMHSGFTALRGAFPMNIEARLPTVGERTLAEQPAVVADVARVTGLWLDCLSASEGPFLFGGFGIADAFFAPVVMRFRTYGVPLDAVSKDYAARIEQAQGVSQWIEGALAEKDFRPFEEPYRSAPDWPAACAREKR
ncbi:MAG TPA: glutathione S-transferase family protein [Burkholderiaceae bacterium]|nr:glutathione S-transferase family protein [Burkholderiaceae bacterium]